MTFLTRPRVSNNEVSDIFDTFNSIFSGTPSYWTPRMDLVEDGNSYHLTVEVPGFEKKDIRVEFEDNVLTVSGEKNSDNVHDERKAYFREIRTGKFERKVRFPAHVESSAIKANYKDGMLFLEIPKTEKAKPTSIEIH